MQHCPSETTISLYNYHMEAYCHMDGLRRECLWLPAAIPTYHLSIFRAFLSVEGCKCDSKPKDGGLKGISTAKKQMTTSTLLQFLIVAVD